MNILATQMKNSSIPWGNKKHLGVGDSRVEQPSLCLFFFNKKFYGHFIIFLALDNLQALILHLEAYA